MSQTWVILGLHFPWNQFHISGLHGVCVVSSAPRFDLILTGSSRHIVRISEVKKPATVAACHYHEVTMDSVDLRSGSQYMWILNILERYPGCNCMGRFHWAFAFINSTLFKVEKTVNMLHFGWNQYINIVCSRFWWQSGSMFYISLKIRLTQDFCQLGKQS